MDTPVSTHVPARTISTTCTSPNPHDPLTPSKLQVDAISTALASNPGLRATFVLDYNRSTRPTRGPGPASTAHMLLPLIERFGDRVDVWLYRTPKLRGLAERIVPPRFNEGWGTWHAKYYAVDDDVVLTG